MRNLTRGLQDSHFKSSNKRLVSLKFAKWSIILISIVFLILSLVSIPANNSANQPVRGILLESSQSAATSTNAIVIMPSFNFTLGGHVIAQSGFPVPNGTIRVSAFNSVYYINTGPNGAFKTTLTVPPDTPDGLYQVTIAYEANGSFGPSSNFTMVNVVREPLNLTLNAPRVIVSGLTATISGSIQSNNSALVGCTVAVALPWGVYYGMTDSTGSYKVSVSVPLEQFSPKVQATISASPKEPYVETAQTTGSIGIINPVEFIVPAIIIGAVVYEARNLELVSKKRIPSNSDFLDDQIETIYKKRAFATASKLSKEGRNSMIIAIYLNALDIAIRRFQIRLVESLTIRQTIEEILRRDKEGKGAAIFSQIGRIMEDFVYSQKFDESKAKDAERLLEKLKVAWAPREGESLA